MKKFILMLSATLSLVACASQNRTPSSENSDGALEALNRECNSRAIFDGKGQYASCQVVGRQFKNGAVILMPKQVTRLGCDTFCDYLYNPNYKNREFIDKEVEIQQ